MNKGGRGRKAPYSTYVTRVPLPIEALTSKIVSRWITLISEGDDSGAINYLSKIEQCIDNQRKKDLLAILQRGLDSPPNNSRKAKEAIRAALELLEEDG
jgi:hypothetical protein